MARFKKYLNDHDKVKIKFPGDQYNKIKAVLNIISSSDQKL